MDMRILKCTLNGRPVQVGYDPRESLWTRCATACT